MGRRVLFFFGVVGSSALRFSKEIQFRGNSNVFDAGGDLKANELTKAYEALESTEEKMVEMFSSLDQQRSDEGKKKKSFHGIVQDVRTTLAGAWRAFNLYGSLISLENWQEERLMNAIKNALEPIAHMADENVNALFGQVAQGADKAGDLVRFLFTNSNTHGAQLVNGVAHVSGPAASIAFKFTVSVILRLRYEFLLQKGFSKGRVLEVLSEVLNPLHDVLGEHVPVQKTLSGEAADTVVGPLIDITIAVTFATFCPLAGGVLTWLSAEIRKNVVQYAYHKWDHMVLLQMLEDKETNLETNEPVQRDMYEEEVVEFPPVAAKVEEFPPAAAKVEEFPPAAAKVEDPLLAKAQEMASSMSPGMNQCKLSL